MANELQLILKPDESVANLSTSYQRQNTNMFTLQTGIDTTKPTIKNGNTIFISNGGIVEVNGSLFKLTSDVSISIPNINNDYFMYIFDNGDNTADIRLSTVYPTFNHSKNGWYTSSNQRVLNNFYMRKIFIKRDASGNNIDNVVLVDIVSSSVSLNLTTGVKYRFQDDTEERTVITQPVVKSGPNRGYIRYNSGLSTIII
jgi:hypothetical protein